jgi:hypothetical protein
MAIPGTGFNSYIQIGEEITPGTGVAATFKLPVYSTRIELEAPPIPDTTLHGAPWEINVAQGARRTKGAFACDLYFEGLLRLLRGAFGAYSNTLVETGVRDHVFKVSTTQLKSFSIEEIVGNISAGTAFRALGQKINKLTLSGTSGQGVESVVRFAVDLVGQDRNSNFTITPGLAFPPFLPVQANGMLLTVDDGTADAAADVRMRSFEFTLESMLTEDRFNGGLATIDEPLRGGKIKARLSFQQEFHTRTQFDAYKALTIGSPKLVFQHPTTIGSSSKREFEIRMEKAYLEADPTPPVDGPGVLIAKSTWCALFDATDASPVVCRVRNTEAALP